MQKKAFQLKSGMTPKGDQPTAIAGLVKGIKEGKRFQTLLGATGTGKSLTWDEKVIVLKKEGEQFRAIHRPIGEIVDHMIEQSPCVSYDEHGVEIVFDEVVPESLYVPSLNPRTGNTEYKKVTAYQRHESPETLFEVHTQCGRSVKVTGDHNFYVLRAGVLTLVRTDDIRESDHIPLPISWCLNEIADLKSIKWLQYVNSEKLFVRPKHGVLAGKQRMNAGDFELENGWKSGEGWVSSRYGQEFDLNLPITDDFLELVGLYIAEGCVTKNYTVISVREEALLRRLEEILNALNIKTAVRPSGDVQINDKALTELLGTLGGKGAFNKHLPDFWTELSDRQLGSLLKAYFAGDGWVDKSAVMCTTVSRSLADQLMLALQRLGIWARRKERYQKASNGTKEASLCHQITISGQHDLKIFHEKINFSLPRKTEDLKQLLHGRENSNVDLAPGAGTFIKQLREKHGLLQKDIAEMAGLSRSAIGLIEQGKREISRKSIRDFLRAWPFEECPGLALLSRSRWSRVAHVKEFKSEEAYVYDFSVEDNETFLAGMGGMMVHNTFTMANVIQELQRPALILAHNKTLAAQLCSELKEMFPDNAVNYFVSYYDYYQPEAYIAVSDTYIEKDAQINDEINKYRHKATSDLLTRSDTIIVASVSCIYGLGSPKEYLDLRVTIKAGEEVKRDTLLRQLTDLQYERSRADFKQGQFHVLGDVVEIFPPGGDTAIRLEFWGDEIEKITEIEPFTGEIHGTTAEATIFPAKHNVTTAEKIEKAVVGIRAELDERYEEMKQIGKHLEAERLKTRTEYDLEILQETGYVSGIENYVRYFGDLSDTGKAPTLMDFFPDDFLLMIDESHMTIPQIGAMHNGNLSRKQNLIGHGFRLPSAFDNRPLKWEEFEDYMKSAIFVSATPGKYEAANQQNVVEQVIRPTGLIDPQIDIRPKDGQMDDLLEEIRKRTAQGDRVLVTTLTKKSSEDLTEYLTDADISVRYLHSDIDTLERIEILRDLRLGVFDVLVGINLLREGLDLPEVSLVAILDADKRGFLRSTTALIQTIGRAARNAEGQVIMYANEVTESMQEAIDETDRRRAIQVAHNKKHGITPATIKKAIKDIEMKRKEAERKQVRRYDAKKVPKEEIFRLIEHLEVEMDMAAQSMLFEKAAELRDEIEELQKQVG